MVASRHHGLVTRAQARRRGLADRQIGGRVASGRWERVAESVFRIAGAPATDVQRTYAAVLAAAVGTHAAGLSSLALLEVGRAPTVPMITRLPSASGRTAGVRDPAVTIGPRDRTRVGPVRCTTPSEGRCSRSPPSVDLVRRSSSTARRGARPAPVHAPRPSSARSGARPGGSGRAGAPSLQQPTLGALARRRSSPAAPAEARLIRRLSRAAGLPEPVLQHRVALRRVGAALIDLAWPCARASGLEYDGIHGARAASARRRRRSRGRAPTPRMVDRTCRSTRSRTLEHPVPRRAHRPTRPSVAV